MDITHNNINELISTITRVVSKGQPFASRNKDRRIRGLLRDVEYNQSMPPSLKEVWFYFKMWIIGMGCRIWSWRIWRMFK